MTYGPRGGEHGRQRSNRANRTTTRERITPTPAMTIEARSRSPLVHASTVAEGHRRTGPGFPGTRTGDGGLAVGRRRARCGRDQHHCADASSGGRPSALPRSLAWSSSRSSRRGGRRVHRLRGEARQRSPVPAGPLGEIVADPAASGPPIECRNVARERCLSAGSIEGMIADIEVSDAERVIVSCEGAPAPSRWRDADRPAAARRHDGRGRARRVREFVSPDRPRGAACEGAPR